MNLATDSTTVLMYHAITRDGGCEGADPHYSVSTRQFVKQMDAISTAGLSGLSVADLAHGDRRAVALTFDDGHISNRAAADILAGRGFSADFFVNPSRVGQRDFLSWVDLRAMAEQGMSIQSHGFHHCYLDELDAQQVDFELRASKQVIEHELGRAVSVFAPPGGRESPRLAHDARQLGYTSLCTSRVGLWRRAAGPWDIPRLAVLQSTSDARFARLISQDGLEMALLQARYRTLRAGKRLLGNGGYERLRATLLRVART